MMSALLESDAGLAIVSAAIGSVWTAFKGMEWVEQRRHERHSTALMAVEAGVEHSFQTYVKAIKAGRSDRKLTGEERKHARALAQETAVRIGRVQGVNVAQELGREFLPVWITRMVGELKRRG
jgi:hypothetical protein